MLNLVKKVAKKSIKQKAKKSAKKTKTAANVVKSKTPINLSKPKISHKSSKKTTASKGYPKKTEMEVLRVATGIAGFDDLIQGGIPENSFTLVSGGTGTGKSIFAINFLAHGAMQGEPGVYVSLEEGYKENKMQMNLFNWEIDRLQKEGKLVILQPKIYNFEKLMESIQDAIDSVGAKRLVLDSISVLEMYFEDQFKTRRNILDLARSLKEMGVTTIGISETTDEIGGMSRNGVEEFLSDSVVILYLTRKGNSFSRAISIRKMRGTEHSLRIHPFEIKSPKGVVVYPFEEVFDDLK